MRLHFQFTFKRNIGRKVYDTPKKHTYTVKERNKKQKVSELPSSE